MKSIILSLLLLITTMAYAQPTRSDTTKRAAPMQGPIILIEAHDTSAVTIVYKGPGHTVLYEDGSVIKTGLKVNGRGEYVKMLSGTILNAQGALFTRKGVIGVYPRTE